MLDRDKGSGAQNNSQSKQLTTHSPSHLPDSTSTNLDITKAQRSIYEFHKGLCDFLLSDENKIIDSLKLRRQSNESALWPEFQVNFYDMDFKILFLPESYPYFQRAGCEISGYEVKLSDCAHNTELPKALTHLFEPIFLNFAGREEEIHSELAEVFISNVETLVDSYFADIDVDIDGILIEQKLTNSELSTQVDPNLSSVAFNTRSSSAFKLNTQTSRKLSLYSTSRSILENKANEFVESVKSFVKGDKFINRLEQAIEHQQAKQISSPDNSPRSGANSLDYLKMIFEVDGETLVLRITKDGQALLDGEIGGCRYGMDVMEHGEHTAWSLKNIEKHFALKYGELFEFKLYDELERQFLIADGPSNPVIEGNVLRTIES